MQNDWLFMINFFFLLGLPMLPVNSLKMMSTLIWSLNGFADHKPSAIRPTILVEKLNYSLNLRLRQSLGENRWKNLSRPRPKSI